MRPRQGFTLFELLVVLAIAGIVMATVVPSIAGSFAQTQLQRAATVIAADLQLAYSMAARQRRPVRVTIDTDDKVLRVLNFESPDTTYSERWFSSDSEQPVQTLGASPTSLVVYPNGLASGGLTITLGAADDVRVIDMNRAGQVRVRDE